MDALLDKIPDVIEIGSLVISLAAGISALTPTPKDDGIVMAVRKVIDVLGLNVGAAKNKDSK